MRSALLLSLTLLTVHATAQKITLDAFRNGKRVGSVDYARKISGSTLTLVTTIAVTENGNKTKYVNTAVYDGAGMPKSVSTSLTLDDSESRFLYGFLGRRVVVAITENGKSTTTNLTAPKKASLADRTAWWFAPGKPAPKVGESCTYHAIAPMTTTWMQTTCRYTGPETLTIGGKKVRAHKISMTRTGNRKYAFWLDNQGMPLKIDQGKLQFVRR